MVYHFSSAVSLEHVYFCPGTSLAVPNGGWFAYNGYIAACMHRVYGICASPCARRSQFDIDLNPLRRKFWLQSIEICKLYKNDCTGADSFVWYRMHIREGEESVWGYRVCLKRDVNCPQGFLPDTQPAYGPLTAIFVLHQVLLSKQRGVQRVK